ncbi:MAG TPA: signal peptidase I [Candidatus Limnocylindrales bacterium]
MRRSMGCLFELLETLLVTLVIFLVIQLFVAQPFHIEQPSMENTLMPDQYVLVDKLSPHFDDYHRGDIVVFAPPASSNSEPTSAPFIKRVIGVAGDTIDIHAGHVFVNGLELSEPYIYPGQLTEPSSPSKHVWTLTVGQLFVMGDHRGDSQDSRVFGPIDKSTVIGRALIRYWPLQDFGLLSKGSAATLLPTATP